MAPEAKALSIIPDAGSLGKDLRAAHIPIPGQNYRRISIIVTIVAGLLFILASLLLAVFGISYNLLPFLPLMVTQFICLLLIIAGVFIGSLYYPRLAASGRKTKIDLDLPHAITYMQALSTTMTMNQIFRGVYEQGELYGEVSRECGLIVRDVELFGDDLLTAMRNVQEITPSEAFRDLLNDLALVFRTGGDMTAFFAARSAHYREQARQELEMTLKTMEIMAEVYVTAFVAGPIALMIMMVAQNMSGQSSIEYLMPVLYIGLPVGAILMIAILRVMMPTDHLRISRREYHETEYGGEVLLEERPNQVNEAFLKQLRSRRKTLRIKDIIRHPLRHYIADYQYSAVFGALFALSVTMLYFTGYIASAFHEYTLEIFICIFVIAFMAPVALAYEIRRWYLNGIEAQMPEFLRDIADMKDMGMTLQGAIHLVAESKLGVLSSELTLVSRDLKMGASVSNALVRLEERIGLVSVKRALSLIVRASEVTDYIREILMIAISDLQHYLKMKNERFSVSFVYIMIVYLSFGIFLYSAYQLNVSFISSFASFDMNYNMMENVSQMFHIAIMLGGFSGLMVGQLSANNILAGLKHSIIFLVASIVLFVYII